jgi:quinol monooxygenase YgiN
MNNERMVRIAEIEIDPHFLEEYKSLLAEEIEASIRLEPGVIFLHAVSIKDAPHMIRVFECYASREAYEQHIKTPHFLKYKTLTSKMVTSLTLIDVDEIELGLKIRPEPDLQS